MSRDRFQRFCSVMTVFYADNGGGGVSQWITEVGGGRGFISYSIACGLADSAQILPCLHDLPAGSLSGAVEGSELAFFFF